MSENMFIIERMFITSTDENHNINLLRLDSKECSELEVVYYK
jgi:hypothetical protein